MKVSKILNKSILYSSILLALGSQSGIVSAAEYGVNNSNFTMLSGGGGAVGGTNLVKVTWDGTYNNDIATAVSNMTIESAAPFFGTQWFANNVQVFGPGSYTFEACLDDGSKIGSTPCGNPNYDPTDPTTITNPLTMNVGAGQVGVHMLFEWNGSVNIDVVNVWNVNSVWGFAPNDGSTTAYLEGADLGCYPGGKKGDPTSPECTKLFATEWLFASTDVNGNGVPGSGMVDGPFTSFNANFNIQPQVIFDDTETAYKNNTGDIIDLLDNDLTAGVDTTGTFVISAVDATTAQGGSITDNGDNTVSYTPPVDYFGADSFTYTISDKVDHSVSSPLLGAAGEYSATATVNIDVLDALPPVVTETTVEAVAATGSGSGGLGLLLLPFTLLLLPLRLFSRKK